MAKVTIAVDAMGGDHGQHVIVPAALGAIQKQPDLHLILAGDQDGIERQLQHNKVSIAQLSRLTIQHASQLVEMDESPSQALRYKKDSSMRVAINLVKEGRAQACVSAGNTGALMATARFVLKTLPGIDRPAIMGLIPSDNELGRVRILDLGANVDSKAEHLFQFAVMGSILTSAVDGIKRPKIALLNIGVEEIKGNEQVKETSRLLQECPDINYVGFVEADSFFKSEADVVVCDGFVGNVALKSIEGLVKFIRKNMKKAFYRNLFTQMAGIGSIFILKPMLSKLDPDLFNGASLLGLRGIVLKSHGNASARGFEAAITRAMHEVEHNVPELIHNEVQKLLENRAAK